MLVGNYFEPIKIVLDWENSVVKIPVTTFWTSPKNLDGSKTIWTYREGKVNSISQYAVVNLSTFLASVPPIQEFELNLSLMNLLAVPSSIVARIALPRSLQALLACKKH